MEEFTTLQVVWFVLISVLWIGYFILEGFDFGVGILMKTLGRDENEKRAILHTIGPVWDGNEVWLLVAGGATFAAFPEWYATLFSGFYLALFVILVALIVRNVGFEFWGKRDSKAWRNGWEWCIMLGSAVPALLWGVAWANIIGGTPINAEAEFTGNFFSLLSAYTLLGGLATLAVFFAHGAIFLEMRTEGVINQRVRAVAAKAIPVALVVAAGIPGVDGCPPGSDPARFGGPGRTRGGRPARRDAGQCALGDPGVRRHDARHRHLLLRDLRRSLSQYDGLEHELGLRHDTQFLQFLRLHADRHDRGCRPAGSGGSRLPGLDLLGLSPAAFGRGLRGREDPA